MPAKTAKQRRLMGAAYGYKKSGGKTHVSAKIKKVAKSMTKSQLRDFARKPHKKSR